MGPTGVLPYLGSTTRDAVPWGRFLVPRLRVSRDTDEYTYVQWYCAVYIFSTCLKSLKFYRYGKQDIEMNIL